MANLNPNQFRPLKGAGASPGPGRGRRFSAHDEAVLALHGPGGTKIPAGTEKSKIPGASKPRTVQPLPLPDARGVLKQMVPAASTRRRISYERANPARYEGDVLEHPAVQAAGITNREEAYGALNWQERPEEGLKGVANLSDTNEPEDPRMLDLPNRWEDMDPKRQARVLSSVARYGVSPDSARRAFGTQLDRSMEREGGRHQSFYEARGTSAAGDLMPRTVLERSAERTGKGLDVIAATNAVTSPKSRFIQKTPGKPTRYPNAEAAELAINLAKQGVTGEQYMADPRKYERVTALGNKVAAAIDIVHGMKNPGTNVSDVWNPGGGPGMGAGDKVRAYFNAWMNPRISKGQFFVSDVHSGGAGMAPHLNRDELSQYLAIPGVHAFHDKIARDVLQERGLTNVSRAQSAQWNQAKYESENKAHRADVEGMRGAA